MLPVMNDSVKVRVNSSPWICMKIGHKLYPYFYLPSVLYHTVIPVEGEGLWLG